MNYIQIKELFERIKMYYNMFTYNDDKVKEWYKFLKDYDSNEVNNNLDRYVSESHDQPPLVYALTSGLQKNREKEEVDIWTTACEICNKHITIYDNDMSEYENHFRECSMIDFIDRMSVKFKGRHVSSVKYYEMSDEELDTAYHQIMDYYLKHKDSNEKIYKDFPTEEY